MKIARASWIVLVVGVAFLLAAGAVVASDASREPSHAPDYSNDFQYPAPTGTAVRATLLEEHFDGSWPPAGWTVVDNLASSATNWNLNSTFSDHNGNYTGGTGTCAMACSDCSSGAFDVELRSPVIDCSAASNVALRFLVNYQNFAGNDTFQVDVSTDGGTNWTNVLSWEEDHGTLNGTPGETVDLDISALADGQSQVMVRFRYFDLDSGAWDWYTQVDDVMVYEVISRAGIPALSGGGIAVMLLVLSAAAVFVLRRRI